MDLTINKFEITKVWKSGKAASVKDFNPNDLVDIYKLQFNKTTISFKKIGQNRLWFRKGDKKVKGSQQNLVNLQDYNLDPETYILVVKVGR